MNRVFKYVAVLLVIINGLFPAIWLLLTSFKTDGELRQLPITYLPENFTLQNYVSVFTENPFGRFLLNSAVVSVVATLLCVFIRRTRRLRARAAQYAGTTRALNAYRDDEHVPALVLLVPLYRLFVGVEVPWLSTLFGSPIFTPNLLNTYWALIIPYVALSLPIATLILTSFFQLIPADLESAALVDGCTRISALFASSRRSVRPVLSPQGLLCLSTLGTSFYWP